MGFVPLTFIIGRRLMMYIWESDTFPVSVVSQVFKLQIPRQVGQGNGPAIAYTLHVFDEASESAYAVAAYLRATHADGRRSTALLIAKSRLAPRDKLRLPHLELMAALFSVRVCVFLLERLTIKIDRVFL